MVLLFAEDEFYTRTGVLESIDFAKHGIAHVHTACDGRDGMALLSLNPDILLTDIRMPFYSGLDIAKQAKENDPDCEVVILSSHTDKQYLFTAIALSTVAYIEKPIDVGELDDAIAHAVERRSRSLLLKNLQREEPKESVTVSKCITGDPSRFSHSTRLLLQYLQEQYAAPDLSVEKLADLVHLNPTYLSGSFKGETGVSLKRMITNIRIEKACQLLTTTNLPITAICVKVGYLDANYFSKFFRKETGFSPNEYRENAGLPHV